MRGQISASHSAPPTLNSIILPRAVLHAQLQLTTMQQANYASHAPKTAPHAQSFTTLL
jgi:hypothetical protein